MPQSAGIAQIFPDVVRQFDSVATVSADSSSTHPISALECWHRTRSWGHLLVGLVLLVVLVFVSVPGCDESVRVR